MSGRFVTFHGIDGTGKTTAVAETVDLLRGRDISTITFEQAGATGFDAIEDAEVAFFDPSMRESIAKKMQQSDQVRDITKSGAHIVKDRWAIDVYADHAFRGTPTPEAVPARIVRPNLAVILLCEESVRQGRIEERGNPTEADLIPNIPGTRAHYFEQYLINNIPRFALRSIELDATDMTAAEVVEVTVEELER